MRARDESRKANRALCDAFRATLRFYEDWVEQADPAQAPSPPGQAVRRRPRRRRERAAEKARHRPRHAHIEEVHAQDGRTDHGPPNHHVVGIIQRLRAATEVIAPAGAHDGRPPGRRQAVHF